MNRDFFIAYIICLIYIIYELKFSKRKYVKGDNPKNWTSNFFRFRPFLFCLIFFIGGTIYIIYNMILKLN